jgi:hypothetical membrane protein
MGVFGILSPLLGFLMLFLSISYTPNFTLTNQTLSELGVGGFGAVLFNGGLMMTGALMMLFSTGLWELGKNNFKGMLGSMMYLIVGLIIVVLSFVTINIDPWHYYLSVALFAFIPLSIIIFSLHLLVIDLRTYAIIGFLTGSASIVIWFIGGPVNGLKELFSLFSLTVWQMPLGYWMLKTKS